jgi:membrane-bound metal-dependent hydrolase YbcI (DUF457 family)
VGGCEMLAIGHFGLGYLLGKASAKIIGTRLNLALLFTVSVLPDFDLILFRFLVHRGPTHSLFFALLISLPFFVYYKKRTIPYFVALLSHSLIGDIYGGMGVQLFWPFSNGWVSIFDISNMDVISVGFELVLFTVSMVVMVLDKDFKEMFSYGTHRIFWLIPFGSVLAPLLVGGVSPLYDLPVLLVLPSLFYLVLFSLLIIGLKYEKF